jgi:hypothetical protein
MGWPDGDAHHLRDLRADPVREYTEVREEFTGPTRCACGRELGFFIRSLGQRECWTCTEKQRMAQRLPRHRMLDAKPRRPPTVHRPKGPGAA